VKDIRGLLYLLPSVLKHAGYYQQKKMDPHSTPFTAESMHSDIIPQQDDGYVSHIYLLFMHFIYFPKDTNVWHFPSFNRNNCGAFLMKYAELIMAGVPTPWKSIFGPKNIKNIRKAIAIQIFSNGQPRNSP
jgi:hypothetical protein